MQLHDEIQNVITSTPSAQTIKKQFDLRLRENNLTRDENAQSHFCVYFAGFDADTHRMFLGHHKKSGLWLFNGGHIDKGERINTALKREIDEEWGSHISVTVPNLPSLLTITKIENPLKQTCRVHYDIWFFIHLNEGSFTPHEYLLEKEFFTWGWKTYGEVKQLVKNAETLQAATLIASSLFHPR